MTFSHEHWKYCNHGTLCTVALHLLIPSIDSDMQSPPSKPFRSRSPPPPQRAGAHPPRPSSPQPYVFSVDAECWTRHSSHHTYPQSCLLLTIASTYFIKLFKQSEATSNATTHPSELILAYLSFLFSMLGALSGALPSGPAPRTRYHDQPAFVESPGRPASANNAFLLGISFQLALPRRMIQRMWDFRE